MKLWSHCVAFLAAALLAYGAIALAKSRQASVVRPSPAPTPPTVSFEEAAATLRKEMAAAAKESGPALKERLGATFKLLGIDASWAEALAADSAAGFPALADKLASLDSRHRGLLELMLMDRWAQLDPDAGAAYFKAKADKLPRSPLGDDGLANFIKQWGLIDFGKAAAKAGEFGDKATRRTLREKAKADPAGFLAWAKDHPDVNPLLILTSGSPENAQAVARLAEIDLDRVLAWAKDTPADKWRPDLGAALAEKLAQRNPDEAIAWAKALGNQAATGAALAGVAKALADSDPSRALGLLKELGGSTDYSLVVTYREIMAKLGLDSPDRALAVIEELPTGTLRDQVLSQALGKMVASDPAKAFALAEKLASAAGNMRYGLDESFAPKTPADARRVLDLAEAAGDSQFRKQVVAMSLTAWLQSDQQSLADYLSAKGGSPMMESIREEFSAGVASMMVQGGLAMDPRLVEAFGVRPEVVLGALVHQDPEAAAGELSKVGDDATRLALVDQVAQQWSGRDRGDAIDWATGLANSDEQAAAFRTLAAGWMSEDSHRASEWISTLPAGKPRDAAVLAMTQQVAATDPDLSWQWGLTMTDPGLRLEALGAAAREWRLLDSAALHTALGAPSLSDEDRAGVVKAMQLPSPVAPARTPRALGPLLIR